MPKYQYVALNAKGEETSGVLVADSESSVIGELRSKGLFPTNVSEAGKSRAAKKGKSKAVASKGKTRVAAKKGGKIKPKNLMIFTRQLATLTGSGLPLLRSLNVLGKQERNPALKHTLTSLADSVQGGGTFSESLAQHPKIFYKLYVSMVKAGELSGSLEVALERLAQFQEKAEKLKNKVKSAMVYPIIVMTMAVGIVTFLMLYIVPKFEAIFAGLLGQGKELPGLTQAVMGFSEWMKANILFLSIGTVAFFVLLRVLGATKGGRKFLDGFKLRVPLIGDLIRKTGTARFSRTLGTLINSGVPILQALNITKDTAGNVIVSEAVSKIHDSVKEGESIVQPMEASRVFPPMVVSMVDVGEETGQLPEMLEKIADVYDDEVDNTVSALTSIIEPIMIVFLAVIVGIIVIALFLPLISIISNLSGG